MESEVNGTNVKNITQAEMDSMFGINIDEQVGNEDFEYLIAYIAGLHF